MRKTVLSLLNYIGCIAMALFVTFIVDGTIGVILTYALIIALLVSLAMTIISRRSISVQAVLSSNAVSKGDRLFLELQLHNRLFFPAPVVEIEVEENPHFLVEGENVLRGSVSAKSVNILRLPITALHSGKAHIVIKNIKLTDYLGIFSFKINTEGFDLTASVFPDIPPVHIQTNLIRTASQFMSSDDDEEESGETSAYPTGIAGYDYREYIPGDPIKRINWKASSKRDILLVRLDESIRGSGRTILLDCPAVKDDDITLTVRDNVIEGSLSLLVSLLREGRDAVYFFSKQGMRMKLDIRTQADIFKLQEELSEIEPEKDGNALSSDFSALPKNIILFTSATAISVSSAAQIISQRPETMLISSYASTLPRISENQWILSEGFDINKM